MPRSSTPLIRPISLCTWTAICSRIARSGPMILTELAPLTPDRPSSMLSCMYWEKLKSTPMNSLENSCLQFFYQFFLGHDPGAIGRTALEARRTRHCRNRPASLPSSGRPCWETTVITSGWLRRISRIFVTAGMAASSDMVGGIDARIQRLPSSRAGRNSVPEPRDQKPDRRQKQESDRDDDFPVGKPPAQDRGIGRTQRPHHNRFSFLDFIGEQV